MKLKLQGLEIQQNFYSFDLHGVDSVEAGTVRGIGGDQRQLQRAHKEVVLRGDPSLYKASVSVQAMVKMMKDVQQGFSINCFMAELKKQPEEPRQETV